MRNRTTCAAVKMVLCCLVWMTASSLSLLGSGGSGWRVFPSCNAFGLTSVSRSTTSKSTLPKHFLSTGSSSSSSLSWELHSVAPKEIELAQTDADSSAVLLETTPIEVDDVTSSNLLGSAIPYEKLTIGILKEDFAGENRVSQTPESAQGLIKAGFKVVVQAGGGCLGLAVGFLCVAIGSCRNVLSHASYSCFVTTPSSIK